MKRRLRRRKWRKETPSVAWKGQYITYRRTRKLPESSDIGFSFVSILSCLSFNSVASNMKQNLLKKCFQDHQNFWERKDNQPIFPKKQSPSEIERALFLVFRYFCDCQYAGCFLGIRGIFAPAIEVFILVVNFPEQFLSCVFERAIVSFSVSVIVGSEIVEVADLLNNLGNHIWSKSVNSSCDDCFRSRDILSVSIV